MPIEATKSGPCHQAARMHSARSRRTDVVAWPRAIPHSFRILCPEAATDDQGVHHRDGHAGSTQSEDATVIKFQLPRAVARSSRSRASESFSARVHPPAPSPRSATRTGTAGLSSSTSTFSARAWCSCAWACEAATCRTSRPLPRPESSRSRFTARPGPAGLLARREQVSLRRVSARRRQCLPMTGKINSSNRVVAGSRKPPCHPIDQVPAR